MLGFGSFDTRLADGMPGSPTTPGTGSTGLNPKGMVSGMTFPRPIRKRGTFASTAVLSRTCHTRRRVP